MPRVEEGERSLRSRTNSRYVDNSRPHHGAWFIIIFVSQGDALKEQLPPQERVDGVRSLWESLSQKDRVDMLTIDVDALRDKARDVTELAKQQGGLQEVSPMPEF